MKIGILTQPLQYNYGGLLQNYALQQALIRLGHEPETIDHGKEKQYRFRHLVSINKARVLHIFFPSKYDLPKYELRKQELSVIQQHTQFFIDKYINHTPIVNTKEGFRSVASEKNYNAYVVGSDQCWRPNYNGSFQDEMFLSFVSEQKGIKRVAYAASFGTDLWEMTDTQTARCAGLAKLFDIISVREASAVDLCNKYLGVNAIQVLDPTMLLKKEDYIKIITDENEPKSRGSLFHYILDPSKEKSSFIDQIAQRRNYIPFTVMPKYQASNRTRSDVKHRIKDCAFPSVTSWLRGFIDAEMVIVDSFHGAVFSIIFNKPFWVIKNGKRGNARFESLLSLFQLENRLIDVNDMIERDWDGLINWDFVNKVLEKERNRSFDILNKGLTY